MCFVLRAKVFCGSDCALWIVDETRSWEMRRQGQRTVCLKSVAGWEHFSHGSDLGVRGFGHSVEEAFEQSAVALTAIVEGVSRIAFFAPVACTSP